MLFININFIKFYYILFNIFIKKIIAENNKDYIVQLDDNENINRVYTYQESTSNFVWNEEYAGPRVFVQSGDTNVYSEFSVIDTSSYTIDANVASWKLYNCWEGECKQTYGYMKSPNESSKFIKLGDGGNAVVTTGFSEACGAADTYKIKSDGTFCVLGHATSTSVITGAMTEGNAFLVETTTNANGKVFKNTADINIIVEVQGNFIFYNNMIKFRGANLFEDQIRISSKDIDDSKLDKLKFYDCKYENIGSIDITTCETSNGYARKGDKLYNFIDGETSSVYTAPESTTCTGHIGEIISDAKTNYLCLNNGELRVDVSKEGFYPLGSASIGSGTFIGKASKMVKISEGLIAVNEFDYPGKYYKE